MPHKERFLQRIQPGLPELIRVAESRAVVSLAADPARVWATWGISPGAARGEFDATLELFTGDRRWSETEIRESDPAEWMRRAEVHARLVLNHDASGCPLLESDWSVRGVAVIPRPALAERECDPEWKAAQAAPCESLRVYSRDETGRWSHTSQVPSPRHSAPPAPPPPVIPVARIARPWSPRPLRTSRDRDFPTGFQIQPHSSRNQENQP